MMWYDILLTDHHPQPAPPSQSGCAASGPQGPPAASGRSGCCCSCWENQERRSGRLWRSRSNHHRQLREEKMKCTWSFTFTIDWKSTKLKKKKRHRSERYIHFNLLTTHKPLFPPNYLWWQYSQPGSNQVRMDMDDVNLSWFQDFWAQKSQFSQQIK